MIRKIIICILVFSALGEAQAQVTLDLEGGIVPSTNYNKVRIPNNGGTLVNLPDELDLNAKLFYRARLSYRFSGRHQVSALYAPLTVTYKGNFGNPVLFNGITFGTGQPVKVNYKFNSYRLTYRYDVISTRKWELGVGLTAKIRDADIRFRNESSDTHFDNIGFVPLVNFKAAYKAARWTFLIEGDALASKQGRAEDIFAGASYLFTPKFGIKAGYRVLEGGADSDEVYNFNWINYASVGVLLTL
ncbi:hypothetical protein [Dyadobacter sandarakinus]|uniref:Outer membrane protein beta-barrel domain-containing protein n=1 Tax=Dyadobacter sandarakinus TaxID=2747268 RepID=A0ABX7I1D7_9BACT|nr:hypothetical protein [Dyadobacter sandarakinus]QRQ99843.1 hypothetical protein HWI92_02380 [Dyadobacter sandarakinus]